MAMDRETLLSIAKEEEKRAKNYDLEERRSKLLQYYDGNLSADITDQEGRSTVTSRDVLDVVEGLLPPLMRRFSMSDEICVFEPIGAEDEEAAKQETDVINHIFWNQCNGFVVLYTWLKDSLQQAIGSVKAWIEDIETNESVSYRGLTQDELNAFVNDDDVEIVAVSEKLSQIEAQGVVIDVKLFDVDLVRHTKKKKIMVEAVPPEEHLVSKDARYPNDRRARFEAHRGRKTVSELIEMGFPRYEAEMMPDATHEDPTETERLDQSGEWLDYEGGDESQREVWCTDAVLHIDVDDDGIAERKHLVYAGNYLLVNEDADLENGPMHCMCAMLSPHTRIGKSPAELVLDIARIKTVLQRGIADNIYLTLDPREEVVWPRLTQEGKDDIFKTGSGVKIRTTEPGSINSLTVPFIAKEAYSVIDYYDGVRKDRTGIGQEILGLDADALARANTGVLSEAMDAIQMKIDLIARVFAETGIKSLFLGLHEMMRKYQDTALTVKLRNQWISVDPRNWRERTDMNVRIGLGTSNRASNAIAIQQIWEAQQRVIEAGGLGHLVTLPNLYHTLAEIVKNAGQRTPELFFTEPKTDELPAAEPQPNPQIEASLQIAQLQAQIEERKLDLEQGKNQVALEKANADSRIKELMAQVDEAKVRVDDANKDADRELKSLELRINQWEAEQKLKIEASTAGVEIEPFDSRPRLSDETITMMQQMVDNHESGMKTIQASIMQGLNTIGIGFQNAVKSLIASDEQLMFELRNGLASLIDSQSKIASQMMMGNENMGRMLSSGMESIRNSSNAATSEITKALSQKKKERTMNDIVSLYREFEEQLNG